MGRQNELAGWGPGSWWAAPDQDVRAQVGAVRPHNRATSHGSGPKHIWIVSNGLEHRTDQKRLNIAFDD